MKLIPSEGLNKNIRKLLLKKIDDENIVDIILINLDSLSGRDFDYEKKTYHYDNLYKENLLKCRNYDICETSLPLWWWSCKGKYLCTNCDIILLSGYKKL